jgi:hypothetical protein
MPWVVPVIMAAGAIYGGISGAAKQKAQQQAAEKAMAQAAAQYGGIVPPEVKELLVEELKKQGVFTPEIESSISAGESNWKAITENKSTVDAQQAALQQMAGVSRTGLQATDRAALNKVRNENQRDIEGKNQQILQEMQARGIGGSGAELAMQIANSQAGAENAADQSDRLAAQAQQNALAALKDTSSMASQARGDDFRVASAKAQAADEMQRFNVSNQRDVAQRNVEVRNKAQAANLDESQRIYEQNIANRRAEALRMEQAKQDRFTNQMNKASALSNIYTGQANQMIKNGKDQAESQQNFGSGLGRMVGAGYKGYAGLKTTDKEMDTSAPSANTQAAADDNKQMVAAKGGIVPGVATVGGDSFENDTVPVRLSPGEVVLPRTVASDPAKIPSFLKKAKSIPEQNKGSKEEKGPSDHDLANHIVQTNALLHSLMNRIHKKGQ